MGGLTSMQTMYHGNLLGRNKPNDILQEVLPNVFAGHVVQSYVGSYGSMIHPVAACATPAVTTGWPFVPTMRMLTGAVAVLPWLSAIATW